MAERGTERGLLDEKDKRSDVWGKGRGGGGYYVYPTGCARKEKKGLQRAMTERKRG